MYIQTYVHTNNPINVCLHFQANYGHFLDAIEWGGRALASRIENLGLTHAKTADSHYNLGILYRLNFEFQDSLKQLTLARNIRATGEHNHSYSLGVADVDYSKGFTETLLGFHDQAFVSFYRAARCRVFRLGANDMQTIQALTALEKERHFFRRVDKKLIAVQLKDRISELKSQPEGMINDGLMAAPPGFLPYMYGLYEDMNDHETIRFPVVRSQIVGYFQPSSDDGSYDKQTVDEMCLLLASNPEWLENALNKVAHFVKAGVSVDVMRSAYNNKLEKRNSRVVFKIDKDEENGGAITRKPFQMTYDDHDDDHLRGGLVL